jgi:hypothetical protein
MGRRGEYISQRQVPKSPSLPVPITKTFSIYFREYVLPYEMKIIFGCMVLFTSFSPNLTLYTYRILETAICQFTSAIYPTK